ncbi:MAG: hypothetical protein ACR2P0_10175 [Acidimicrobiales bacterium]
MERHLHLVPAGNDLAEPGSGDATAVAVAESNVVDLELERQRRRHHRYHPSAGRSWLDDLFDDDDLDPVC